MKHSLRMAIAMILSVSFFSISLSMIPYEYIKGVKALESSWRFAPDMEDHGIYIAGERDDIPYNVTLTRRSRPLTCRDVTLDGFQVVIPDGRSLEMNGASITFKNCRLISEDSGYGLTIENNSHVIFTDCTFENQDLQNSLFHVSNSFISLISCSILDHANSPVFISDSSSSISLMDTKISASDENRSSRLVNDDLSTSLFLKGTTEIAGNSFPINAEMTTIVLEDFTGSAYLTVPLEGSNALVNNSIIIYGANEQSLDHLFLPENDYAVLSFEDDQLVLCIKPTIQLFYGDKWQFFHRLSQEEMRNGWLLQEMPEETVLPDQEIIYWKNSENASIVPFGNAFLPEESSYEAVYDEKNILRQADETFTLHEGNGNEPVKVSLQNIGVTDIVVTDIQLEPNDFITLQNHSLPLIPANSMQEVVLLPNESLQIRDRPVSLSLHYTYHRNLLNAALKTAIGNLKISVIPSPVVNIDNQESESPEEAQDTALTIMTAETILKNPEKTNSQILKSSPNTMGENLLPEALVTFGAVLTGIVIVMYELKHL